MNRNAWRGGGSSTALSDTILRGAQQDVLSVPADSNGRADGIGGNNDSVANYQSNYSTVSSAGC